MNKSQTLINEIANEIADLVYERNTLSNDESEVIAREIIAKVLKTVFNK